MTDFVLDEIRAARQELDAVVEEIRGLEGFERFLASPTFDDIAHAAADSPIVYLAAADLGGLALIVSKTEVVHVLLPDINTDSLRERVNSYLESLESLREHPERDLAVWPDLDELTHWLWEVAMGPVLERLSKNGWTRAALVAGGLLGVLPLQAAWTEDRHQPSGRRYVIDEVMLTYAPNARALSASRQIVESSPGTRLLAVVDPQPVRADPLPFAAYEVQAAQAAFGQSTPPLSGGRATPLTVSRRLPKADVLHLACHGIADLASPLDSRLLLAGDLPLKLRDIMRLGLAARLAVLSACETSLPGTALPDEVVSLSTGLLQAGVAGVVASLWGVADVATAMLMTEFYRGWRGRGLDPPVALQCAQIWLRDTTNGEKKRDWDRQAGADEGRLPATVADAFSDAIAWRHPESRDEAHIGAWGAFTYVGV